MTAFDDGIQVRHRGSAQIRGKIRRIWRPRYLELCDNGSVRYYEIHANVTSTNHHHHTYQNLVTQYQDDHQDNHEYIHSEHNIPKCTLQVYHARIIDVTTFRDLHVGLPKGTYGFVFHGQRHVHPDILACHPPEHVTPRDFLCAVGTLEEAQSWVVALQWAASCAATQPRSYSEIWIHNSHDDIEDADSVEDDDISEDMDGFATVSPPARSPRKMSLGKNDRNIMMSPNTVRKYNTRNTAASKRRSAEKQKQQLQGKTVVTKVRNFKFIQSNNSTNSPTKSSWRTMIQVGYEIRLLLLRTRGKKLIVEERSIVRSKHDFDVLLNELRNLHSKAAASRKSDGSTTQILNDFETYLKDIQAYVLSFHNITKSIACVDKMLRTLAMDATIINSDPMRSFWNMSSSSSSTTNGSNSPSARTKTTSKSKSTQQQHKLSDEPNKILSVQTYALTSQLNTDEIVKQWLLKDTPPTRGGTMESYVAYMLQNPSHITVMLGVILVGVPFLIRQYQTHVTRTMELRLDHLIVSYIIILWIGRSWGERTVTAKMVRSSRGSSRDGPKRKLQGSVKDSSTLLNKPRKSQVMERAEEDECITGSTSSDDDEAFASDESTASGGSSLPSSSASPTEERKRLASPLPEYPANSGESCWSKPQPAIFRVRGKTYLTDRIKIPSAPPPFECLGVDFWLTDNPERHIARHPSVLGGKLGEVDTFVVNFLLPFGNFVSYFAIPPLEKFPPNLAQVWSKFLAGDQQYRDARLKLLPVVVDGPWIVKKAVGSGTSPALLGKVIPLQYYFRSPDEHKKGIYEVDVIVSASRIGNGILSVVKGHTNTLTIAFAFIIEAAEEEELPETALCTFQMHSIHLEDCPQLPECNLDEL